MVKEASMNKLVIAALVLLTMQANAVALKKPGSLARTKKVLKPKAKPASETPQISVRLQGQNYFQPSMRLPGIGLSRVNIDNEALNLRTQRSIEAQTFAIMRDPRAVLWAERVNSKQNQSLFLKGSKVTGFSKELVEGLICIESGGDPNAESPTGPKGLMQMAGATAKRIGLEIMYEIRYRIISPQKKSLKPKKVPYKFLVKDERLDPEKSLMAGMRYLAALTKKYGREDFALWAYHSGEGYPNKALALARKYKIENPTVAKLFFDNSPIHHKDLFDLIQKDMSKDFGSTYYFRVKKAAELMALYRSSPDSYRALANAFQNSVDAQKRAPNRLFVWYSPKDIKYHSRSDLAEAKNKKLFAVPVAPAFLGFEPRTSGFGAIGEMDPEHRELYLQAPKEVLGMLEYVSFETRRLWNALDKKKEIYVPLSPTAFIRDMDYQVKLQTGNKQSAANINARTDLPTHTIGAVDVSYLKLPKTEFECLKFVVQDLGWDEYLGFFEESKSQKTFHLAPAPSQIDFYKSVYEEAKKLIAKN